MCIPACPVSGVENMSEGRAAACRSLPRTPDCHRWLATDDPDEGSEPVHQRLGSFAAHEWDPTHVLQTSPASDGPAHFPHPGHPWPASDGNQEREATNDTQPPDPQTYSRRHSPDKPGCTLQPWNPEAINPGAPYMTW